MLTAPKGGNDTVSGGDGNDTTSFAGWGSGVSVNLGLTTAQAVSGGSVTLNTQEVKLGSGASQPVLAGSAFPTWFGGTLRRRQSNWKSVMKPPRFEGLR